MAGDFFDSCLIVSGWRKLPRKMDVVCFVWVIAFGGLTGDFAGFFSFVFVSGTFLGSYGGCLGWKAYPGAKPLLALVG
jgi:hypothetical protein